MCESSSLMPPSPSPPRPRRLPGQPPEYKHFCRVCNKGFTCGSALGGHMRAHGASDVVDGFGADDGDSPADEQAASAARCRGGGGDDQCEAVAATHAYALRANSNRLIRSCQVCKNCGKEFTSWELFLQHGKCNSEDEEEEEEEAVDGLLGSLRSSSPSSNGGGDAQEDPAVAAAWSKGKRSRRVNLMVAGDDSISTPAAVMPPSSQRGGGGASGEEEDLANCLVMLSSSSNIVDQPNAVARIDRQEPACASTSKLHDDERPSSLHAQPISFFAPAPKPAVVLPSPQYIPPASSRNLFECKACKKVFTSHQALGGHRASHKKVKGCFAAKFDTSANETAAAATTNPPSNNGNNSKGAAAVEQANNVVGANADDRTRSVYATAEADTAVGTTSEAVVAPLSMALAPLGHDPLVTTLAVAAPGKKNTKMHECSVCHRLFSSGQALGGHKRCHWLTSGTADPCNPVANMIPPLTEDLVGVVRHQLTLRPMVDAPEPALDLTIAANPLAPAAGTAQPEAGSNSCFRLDAIAPVHLQPLAVAVPSTASHRKKTTATSSHHATDAAAEDDEADSTAAKRAKLSDLKDVVSMDGEPTEPWLQVGIGSSSAGGDDKSRNSAT
ncbi:hypothetical protein U9M48_033403 [Paspalum notatum var. saurae]|uniref:C2H2-type domain-containing protein n=1 Tax=Paspalum notatum var. saurae TaxID=547442 RepID=A0AAQ3X5Y4_PASNO